MKSIYTHLTKHTTTSLLLWIAPLVTMAQTTLINEGFTSGLSNTAPSGWTVSSIPTGTNPWNFTDINNNVSGSYWFSAYPAPYGCDSPSLGMGQFLMNDGDGDTQDDFVNYAFVMGSNSSNSNYATTLESPAFNTSGATTLSLDFDAVLESNFPLVSGRFFSATIEVFDGTTWDTVYQKLNERDVKECNDFPCTGQTTACASPYPELNSLAFSKHHSLDIVTAAGGATNAKLRFTATHNGFFLWAVDNVFVLTNGSPLPIDLLRFTAKAESSRIRLDWESVGSEKHPLTVIERSPDARNWVSIDDNNEAKQSTLFYDNKPLKGQNYYRLSFKENDGSMTYSKVCNVLFGKVAITIPYPNPAHEQFVVTVPSGARLVLYNMLGQETTVPVSGNGPIKTINTKELPEGFYSLQLYSATEKYQYKILVRHQ